MTVNNTFYTYRHIRPDTGEVFYIGKGRNRRAWSHSLRSNFWNSIVNKNNGIFIVELITKDLNPIDADLHERYLISFYGRRDLGLGILCNLTDGGEGAPGKIVSEETRKKMSSKRKGKPCTYIANQQTKKKMSESRKKVKDSIDTINKRAISNSKSIINKTTGEIFPSLILAAASIDRKPSTVCCMLKGKLPNWANFDYIIKNK